MSPNILVFSEELGGSYELLTKAVEFTNQLGEVWAVVLGKKEGKETQSMLEYGAKRVLTVPNVDPSRLDAESLAFVLCEIAKADGPDVLLIRSTRLGKETAGRVAQKLQAGCITDAIGVEIRGSDLVAHRYALGGNTISSEVITTKKKVISVMPGSFEAHNVPSTGEVKVMDLTIPTPRVEVVERRKKTGGSANIESAETLVCVGQGVSKKEDLAMINEFCTILHAELGSTRPIASDLHWVSEDRMVGISGKKCKPKFHFSIGISGQIQHTVGVMSSKLIVAINKDKDAPIFKIADYGIVGDLYQVVPELTRRLKAGNHSVSAQNVVLDP
jgi:electron transfer flavoprotein alpha subunit